jgi:hypothetical protein
MEFGGVITLGRLSMEPVCEPRSATYVSTVQLVPTHMQAREFPWHTYMDCISHRKRAESESKMAPQKLYECAMRLAICIDYFRFANPVGWGCDSRANLWMSH